MEKRKNLHDSGLALVIVGLFHLFIYIATVVESLVDGSVSKLLAGADPTVSAITIATLVIISVFFALLVSADIFVGVKALKVSLEPTATIGYIVFAKIFCAVNLLGAIAAIISLCTGSAPVIDSVLSLSGAVFGASLYVLAIKAGYDVRNDVLASK